MAKTRSARLVLPPLSVTTISVYTTSYTLELLNVLHMDSYDMNDIQISNSKSLMLPWHNDYPMKTPVCLPPSTPWP